MKVGIMQPYFFPYLAYWQLIAAVDQFLILDDVNYIKQGYINRNQILGRDRPQAIIMPVKDISSFRTINDHEILSGPWKTKMLKTIGQTYSKAPCFEQTFQLIEACFDFEQQNLADFLAHTIRKVAEFLRIQTPIKRTSENPVDQNLSGEDRVIALCKQNHADTYINSIGGRELYAGEHFAQHEIELKFLEMNKLTYVQFSGDFQPNLSIIDVMMFNKRDQLSDLMTQYKLI